jgi:uncharacterized membrane protein YbhN (UPF0104 family)
MTLRRLLLLAKLLMSIGLVWYVAAKFDLQKGLTGLGNIGAKWLFTTLALYCLQTLLVALRLREFLRVMDARVGLWRSLDATLIGYFFSQTFISFVGGDAMRVYRISRYGVPLAPAAKAIVLDRASGFAAQMLLIVVATPVALPLIEDRFMRVSLLLLVAFGLAAGASTILISRLPESLRSLKALDAIADVSGRVLRRISTPKGAAAFFGYSLAISALNVLIFFSIAKGLNVAIGLVECFALLPPVFLMSMLPISISGWGVREGAAILAFGLLGIAATDALAVSVMFGLGLILISLPGGALWIVTRRGRPTVREGSDAKNQT